GDILFTSGATEGIQTAVVSTLIAAKNHSIDKPVLLYGATEHKAVPNTLIHWNEVLGINAQVLAIPVSSEGILDLDFIAQHADKALMICTMAVNNET
ncbi:aminotransferase class V-fold PLP-dependent enzyme, partial [Streptomyces brasiliscabiei]